VRSVACVVVVAVPLSESTGRESVTHAFFVARSHVLQGLLRSQQLHQQLEFACKISPPCNTPPSSLLSGRVSHQHSRLLGVGGDGTCLLVQPPKTGSESHKLQQLRIFEWSSQQQLLLYESLPAPWVVQARQWHCFWVFMGLFSWQPGPPKSSSTRHLGLRSTILSYDSIILDCV
jgi:hypothetical protein